jgi:uncharacterized OB-fold protein
MNTSVAPTIRQKIQIPYKYSAGPAMTKFLRGLQDEVIFASVCSGCSRRSIPPIGFCGRCWRPIEEYVEVEQRGVIESLVSPPDVAGQAGASAGESSAYALIRLQDCTTNLVHLVRWNVASPIGIGSLVVPVWQEERTAGILDIAYFRPA